MTGPELAAILISAQFDNAQLTEGAADAISAAFATMPRGDARVDLVGFALRPPQRAKWGNLAERDLERVDPTNQVRIRSRVAAFVESGDGDIRKVHGWSDRSNASCYALRVGRLRVFVSYEPGALVVLRVLPRGIAYKR
jgi:mRNA-degrading endonuclease RelE of RelBE toxin-antitoxin system